MLQRQHGCGRTFFLPSPLLGVPFYGGHLFFTLKVYLTICPSGRRCLVLSCSLANLVMPTSNTNTKSYDHSSFPPLPRSLSMSPLYIRSMYMYVYPFFGREGISIKVKCHPVHISFLWLVLLGTALSPADYNSWLTGWGCGWVADWLFLYCRFFLWKLWLILQLKYSKADEMSLVYMKHVTKDEMWLKVNPGLQGPLHSEYLLTGSFNAIKTWEA